MNGTLFNITQEFQRLYDMGTDIDYETDPELAQIFEDTLSALQGELEVKANGCIHVLKQWEMEAEKCKELEYEWSIKKKRRENAIKRMKQALLEAMIATGNNELEAGEYKLKIKNNGGVQPLIIDDPHKIPDNLTKITIEPDTKLIREYLAEHSDCEFAHLGPRGQHVKID